MLFAKISILQKFAKIYDFPLQKSGGFGIIQIGGMQDDVPGFIFG